MCHLKIIIRIFFYSISQNVFSLSFIQDSYERAKDILKTYSKEHKKLADALLTYETLDAKEIQMVLEGKSLDHYRPQQQQQALQTHTYICTTVQSSTGLWEALFCLYPFYCQCEDDIETIINALIRLIIYFPSVICKSSQFNCVKITICSPQKVTKMVSFRAFFSFLSSHRERKTKPQQRFMHQGHISSHMNLFAVRFFSHICTNQ